MKFDLSLPPNEMEMDLLRLHKKHKLKLREPKWGRYGDVMVIWSVDFVEYAKWMAKGAKPLKWRVHETKEQLSRHLGDRTEVAVTQAYARAKQQGLTFATVHGVTFTAMNDIEALQDIPALQR